MIVYGAKKNFNISAKVAIESERVNEGKNIVCCILRPAESTLSVYGCVSVFAS